MWGSSLKGEEGLTENAPALSVPFLQRRGAAQGEQQLSLPSASHTFWALVPLPVLPSVPKQAMSCLPAV